MKLSKLVANLTGVTILGSVEVEVMGITASSKEVLPGYLFIAKGKGGSYIAEAVERGALAVLSDAPALPHVRATQLCASDMASAEFTLLNRFYDHPAEKLFIVGITGTNGKTTTSYLVRAVLPASGLIGTIECLTLTHKIPSTHTTPDLPRLMWLFHEMVVSGCKSVVMEVSSHALDQGRVHGILFDIAIFTNFTQDHLDYHKTMDNYAAAKAKLFSALNPEAIAIYNKDDPAASQIVEPTAARRLSYGFAGDLVPREVHLTAEGTEFTVSFHEQTARFSSSLVGKFNLYNLLAAVGVGIAIGLDLETIAKRLKGLAGVPGRLERVEELLFVDYAHTEDALLKVLSTLNEFKKGRIITVFGCGGSRDTGKRPKMAAVAERFSDCVIVTSDNPRKENPEKIIEEILSGFTKSEGIFVESDRRLAITKAVEMARREDIVLVAGKGHEEVQIFATHEEPFSDRTALREALNLIRSRL